ncbi:MAG TPA: response regulator [Vicinamibacterales bacterium]
MPSTGAAPGNRFRVLVLDDDPATLALEQRALQRAGFTVVPAATTAEAAAIVAEGAAELLVLDYRLSGAVSGLDFFRKLREEGRDIPALLVTSFADERKVIEALRAGVRDVVPKSGDYLEYLPQAVQRIVGQLEAERQLARSEMLQNLVDRLRQETQTLETINAVGRRLVAELDLHRLLQSVVDACTSMVGARFGAFFYSVVGPGGSESSLHALSGALRDQFEHFPRPGERGFFGPDFTGDTTVISEDITRDERFAGRIPQPGALAGTLPVRSYLAVPVRSRTGERLGGLFFGHPEPNVFRDREARIVEGIAAQAATAIDNARLVAALRESENRLRLATEATRLGTWELNPVTGALQWSERCYELFSLPADAKPDFAMFLSAVHPADRDLVQRAVQHALDPHGSGEYRAEFRTVGVTDGRERWVRTDGRAIFENGRAVRLIGTAQDVTDERRNAEEREALLESERIARAEAERASRLKDDFLATLSHELRTPLNAILGWAQLLRARARTEADIRDGLDTIERNARAQAQIIDDLLDMSRIISGKLRLDVQRIDLAALVAAAIETVRPAAEAKGIELKPTLDSRAGIISGDPGRVQQVLWNLLSNAIKFTGRGGHIEVKLVRRDSHVELSVIDDGEGIKPDFLPYLFDRFRQGDSSTTRQHRGMGLGLSIVKNLVEMHGGSVHAHSDGEGCGSTFTVTLPLVAAPPEAEEPVSPRREPPSVLATGDTEAPGLAGVHVLVVDDDADARELISRVLREYEAVVDTVSSAAEALRALDAGLPDVLVSDIGMPHADGYSLIRQIRSRSRDDGGTLPAVALTAFARPDDRRRALLAGYQAHLAKPVDPSDLVTVIASLTGRIVAPT